MSVEEKIEELATAARQLKSSGRFGHNRAEADIHQQLDLIWEALMILARKVDREN